MSRRRTVSVATLALCAVLGVGCGDDDESGTTSAADTCPAISRRAPANCVVTPVGHDTPWPRLKPYPSQTPPS